MRRPGSQRGASTHSAGLASTATAATPAAIAAPKKDPDASDGFSRPENAELGTSGRPENAELGTSGRRENAELGTSNRPAYAELGTSNRHEALALDAYRHGVTQRWRLSVVRFGISNLEI